MKKGIKTELFKIRAVFFALFGVLIVLVLLTPHIDTGHLPIPERYAQSLVLFIEMIVGYVFYGFYKRMMNKLHEEKNTYEQRLLNSYGYIGKMNNLLDLFKDFGKNLFGEENSADEKEIFKVLLSNMLITVAKSEKGFLRFINSVTGNTVKESYFSKDGTDFAVGLSNADLLMGKIINKKDFFVIKSDYADMGVICVLCLFKPDIENVDMQILKPLLNQTHLLYLAMHNNM